MNIPKHHIDNAILYLQDFKETDKPWERWQYKIPGSDSWEDFTTHSSWAYSTEYRRKPKMIKVQYLEMLVMRRMFGVTTT